MLPSANELLPLKRVLPVRNVSPMAPDDTTPASCQPSPPPLDDCPNFDFQSVRSAASTMPLPLPSVPVLLPTDVPSVRCQSRKSAPSAMPLPLKSPAAELPPAPPTPCSSRLFQATELSELP